MCMFCMTLWYCERIIVHVLTCTDMHIINTYYNIIIVMMINDDNEY